MPRWPTAALICAISMWCSRCTRSRKCGGVPRVDATAPPARFCRRGDAGRLPLPRKVRGGAGRRGPGAVSLAQTAQACLRRTRGPQSLAALGRPGATGPKSSETASPPFPPAVPRAVFEACSAKALEETTCYPPLVVAVSRRPGTSRLGPPQGRCERPLRPPPQPSRFPGPVSGAVGRRISGASLRSSPHLSASSAPSDGTR